MTRPTAVLSLLTALLLGACSSFDVHGPGGELEGVPFFAKRGVLRQTTVETRTWMELTLVRQVPGEDGQARPAEGTTLWVDEASWDAQLIEGLVGERNLAEAPLAATLALFRASRDDGGAGLVVLDPLMVAALTEPGASVPAGSGVTVRQTGNTTALAHEVDYTRPLTFNVEAPWFGSAEGSVELNADGSLSKGSATIDTTGLGGELPLTEYLLDSLGLAGAALLDAEPSPRLVIKAVRKGYRYTYRRTWIPGVHGTIDLDQRVLPALTASAADSVERAALGSSGGSQPDKDAVTFSGSVKLPKD